MNELNNELGNEKTFIFSAIWVTSSIIEIEVKAENEQEAEEKVNEGDYDVVDDDYSMEGNSKLEDLQLMEINGVNVE